MSDEAQQDSAGHADAEKGTGVRFDKATGESVNIVAADIPSYGLTKSELKVYADDPTWIKIRWSFFSLFWLVWLGMLGASLAIILQTSCKSNGIPDTISNSTQTTIASVTLPTSAW